MCECPPEEKVHALLANSKPTLLFSPFSVSLFSLLLSPFSLNYFIYFLAPICLSSLLFLSPRHTLRCTLFLPHFCLSLCLRSTKLRISLPTFHHTHIFPLPPHLLHWCHYQLALISILRRPPSSNVNDCEQWQWWQHWRWFGKGGIFLAFQLIRLLGCRSWPWSWSLPLCLLSTAPLIPLTVKKSLFCARSFL